MSKWIAGLLVLVNLGVWMWILWYADSNGGIETPLPRAEVQPQKLRLVSEPGVKLVPRATATPAAATAACVRLGPFTAAAAADRAATLLTERGIHFERHREERRATTGYRVYLPPFASREAAEAKRAELTRLGFHDHAVIDEPGMENALSLGLYAIEANAERHQRLLEARGVPARLQTLHQTRTVYWLELRAEEPALGELRQVKWGDEVTFLTEACATAAAEAPAATP
jgi:hypothetical protein